jgi:hypothetical protein
MVNPLYAQQKTIVQIMNMFNAQKDLPSIQLPNFFTDAEYGDLKKKVLKLKSKKIYDPVKYRMHLASVPSSFVSEDVLKFIAMVTGKKVAKLQLQALSFSNGDYTLICEEDGSVPGIDIMFDFSDDLDKNIGGSAIYVDGTGEYFKIPPKGNSLTLVKRPKKNIRKFVQYLNHYAKNKKRILVIATIS